MKQRTVPQQRFIPSRGLVIEVLDWGDFISADLIVICAHGYLDCAGFFTSVADDLLDTFDSVAVRSMSFAGHGESSWADSYGWADHTADLIAVIDETRRSSPRATLCLLGHSFGSVHTIDVARYRPELVDILVDLDAVAPPQPSGIDSLAEVIVGRSERTHGTRGHSTYDTKEELIERRALANPLIPHDTVAELVNMLIRPTNDGRWSWKFDPLLVGRIRPWDATPGAPADPVQSLVDVHCPTLVLVGADDDHPSIRGDYPGDEALKALTHIEHQIIEGAGHYLHFERPDVVLPAIREFLVRTV